MQMPPRSTPVLLFLSCRVYARTHVVQIKLMYPGRATCIRIRDTGYIYVDGYKLHVRDTCRLYLGDIITIHSCHGRLVSLCIKQQTGNKLATILSPIQDTCRRRQVDTSGYTTKLMLSRDAILLTFCFSCQMKPRHKAH